MRARVGPGPALDRARAIVEWTGPRGPGPGPAKLAEVRPGPTRGQPRKHCLSGQLQRPVACTTSQNKPRHSRSEQNGIHIVATSSLTSASDGKVRFGLVQRIKFPNPELNSWFGLGHM